MMSDSVTKICDQYSSTGSSQQNERKTLKFADFYAEIDQVLVQLPYVDALRFNLECMERANVLLQKSAPNKSQE